MTSKSKNRYKLFTDGGARGNPGPAGVGCVLVPSQSSATTSNREGEITFKEYIGISTNNEAEYMALISGLTLALEHGITQLDCFLDSELVVKQLNGLYRVKNERLSGLFSKVSGLRSRFADVTFTHIPRAANSLADALVNQALDEKLANAHA